ncbi:MAG TPA: 50S ribosomal protein L20 [Spirochaetota bacterium]|nr:50S ribosomal protein L20 [Spirochaetota bacterium]HOL56055.1 50S ribosomal protein L20 [Spirochaetota bacterium]HPP03201.1 50S ribosomal protein L20 [Spirochaetota bacterium]
MSRAITGRIHRKRAKKVLKLTKGYRGARSKLYRVAKNAMIKSLQRAFAGRKDKKAMFRQLWITRINAACREAGISYSKFINGLKKAGIIINRKNLANLAIQDITTFDMLIEKAKSALQN